MDTETVDLRGAAAAASVLEATLTLATPRSRLRLRLPGGEAGRADAVLGERVWAAKHYWREQGDVTVYEFDEPLPAGPITLRVPLARAPASR